jgi:hypothetical protein
LRLRGVHHIGGSPVNEFTEFQEKLDIISKSVLEQCHFIILMLNPHKPQQFELRNTLNEALGFMAICVASKRGGQPASFDDEQYRDIQTRSIDALTNIGIETWKQIKTLE